MNAGARGGWEQARLRLLNILQVLLCHLGFHMGKNP